MPAPAHTVREGIEFSRVVRVHRGIRHAWVETFQATRGECAGLAHRFSLVALEYLRAKAEMTPRSGRDGVNACVSFQGGVIQSCVLTLDPAEAWGKAHRRGPCADRVALRWTLRRVGGPDKTGELKVSHGGTETKSLEVAARYASRASSAASCGLRGMLQLW